VALILICFLITKPMPLKDIYTINSFMNFLNNDSKIYHDKGYEVYAIVSSPKEFLDNFKDVKNLDYINWKRADSYSGDIILKLPYDDYVKNNKPAVIYMSGLAGNISGIADLNRNAYFYRTTTSPNHFIKVIYETKEEVKKGN